ncbi:unnamed protein product [marine sediment metagenome]|uniref:Uncharacterized protein n=1 Tax=marine sediment metagenome TaxID=412755 RepID=X1PW34_9ZZZZ
MADEFYWVGTGANVEERAVPTAGKSIATGSYTGNGDVGRQITTGFKCSCVIIANTTDANQSGYIVPGGSVSQFSSPEEADGALHASDGFTVGHTAGRHLNLGGNSYRYWAISE